MPTPEGPDPTPPGIRGSGLAPLGPAQLRWGLGLLWILDAGLQLQPVMFTRAFAGNVLYNAALMYQPGGLETFLYRAASIETAHLEVLTILIASIQLLLGAGLLSSRLSRPALIASVVWATVVWTFGQGLGFLATGTALIEFGAPGSALMYLAIAALAWPRGAPGRTGAPPAPALLGRWIWSGYWALGAILHLPLRFPTGAVLAYNLQTAAQLQPGSLQRVDYHLARYADGHGLPLSVILAAVELALALGVWPAGWRRPVLAIGVVLTAAFWVLGQAMGGILAGVGTDPSTGPVVALLALCLWGNGGRRSAPDPGRQLSPDAKKDPAMTYSPTPSPGQYHRR